ncbi:hypothetical protein FRC17_001934 [Serendipita sp. 399]|nr:hypothetical protein FRC17_001934 [Serendipita sp. 399]
MLIGATGMQLYALYKMVTVSKRPNVSKPSIFDMTGRAKWDAWDKASKDYSQMDMEALQNKYLDRCKELGWVLSASTTLQGQLPGSKKLGEDEQSINDIDWDAPNDSQTTGHRQSDKAMGTHVSVMEQEDIGADSTTLHGLAILGDEGKLKTLLQLGGTDINLKDEFGYTALHLAADRGNIDVVRLLTASGADLSIQDDDGFTALELAEASGKEEIVDLLKSP